MKKDRSTKILIVIFFVGLAVLLYPTVSNLWNSHFQSQAIAGYDSTIATMSEADYTEMFAEADAYNDALNQLSSPLTDYEQIEGYEDTLDITGTGIMGYITIPLINVQLPIYHGTDEGVLQVAAGHLQGSSLPVGGESTHCVISAHRGLPSAKLFTNLDKLEVGDTFTITVLDEVLTYEVDQILIVLPEEVDALGIVEGEDLCTLVTCTPYGINTHRLLVRGHRIETENTVGIHVQADGIKVDSTLVAIAIAVPILIALLIWMLFSTRNRKGKRKSYEKEKMDTHHDELDM